MNGLLRLFLLRFLFSLSILGFTVTFFFAYPYQVLYWQKSMAQAFQDSWINWFACLGFLFLFILSWTLIDSPQKPSEPKKEKPKPQPQVPVETDKSIVY